MLKFRLFPILFTLAFYCQLVSGQGNNATLRGTVTDQDGNPLELVNIAVKDSPLGTTSNRDGNYLLRIPARRKVVVVISSMGYKTMEKTFTAKPEEGITWDVKLTITNKELSEVTINEARNNPGNIKRINPKLVNSLPNAGSGGVEALLKTMPGVSSNNELSSQYSVRGGNFDENLVYVNGIEIYRPFLVRSGQQEGLSFINPDLVSSIEFSSGGFDARYGDKMSSVLDIKYRKPVDFEGSASASMLGATAHVEDRSKNGKLSYIAGVRYKTNKYLLGSLDEKGNYDPRFIDLQSYITYEVSDKLDLSFLGNFTQNQYRFIPQTRETTFGTWDTPLNTTIYFEGNEIDDFTTYLGALSADFHPNNNLNLKFIASSYYTTESETYDILGQYYLNELERNMSSKAFGDSILNLGVGTFINHARNYLDARVISLTHNGAYNSEKHLVKWGARLNIESIDDRMNEWIYRDSSGYSLPYSADQIYLFSTTNGKTNMLSARISGYIQDTYSIPIATGGLYFTGGVRANYWDFNNELVVSPRVSLSYRPAWKNNVTFKLATGVYDQPPFYKELRDRQGNLHPDVKSQRSYQVVLGSDYIFTAWERPFRFTSEIYYKDMERIIPYQIDNVRIWYLPDQQAKGYAAGVDMKVNGEFVSGLQSWASLSLMRTMENIYGDGHSWIPRPTDQWMNFSLYFQDYLPGNPSYKMHMTAFYGSPLPTGPPNSQRWQDVFRMPPYRRVDLGFSKVVINEGNSSKSAVISHIKELEVSLEVFNLLNINNTVSYFWVSSNSGDMFAVPNYLTSRKINLKLSIKF